MGWGKIRGIEMPPGLTGSGCEVCFSPAPQGGETKAERAKVSHPL